MFLKPYAAANFSTGFSSTYVGIVNSRTWKFYFCLGVKKLLTTVSLLILNWSLWQTVRVHLVAQFARCWRLQATWLLPVRYLIDNSWEPLMRSAKDVLNKKLTYAYHNGARGVFGWYVHKNKVIWVMPTLEKADANPEDVPHFAYQQFMPLCIEKQKGLKY